MLVLVAAAALALATVWAVVPAPTAGTLVMAVIAPEWSPYYAVLGLSLALFAGTTRHGRLGYAIALLSFVAVLESLPALAPYPELVTSADAALRALPGDRGWPISPYDPIALTGRLGVTIDDDIAVPLHDGSTLALDLYRPWSKGPHPAVVVVYGGAWAFGDRQQCRPLAIDLARAGYSVVMVDYRHAPQFPFPIPVDDVRDALALVARQHVAWGIDPARVALLGRSAGAQIALMLASTPGPVHVAAAVGLYAPVDLAAGYGDPPDPDPSDVRGILRAYLGGAPDEDRLPAYRRASPQSYVATLHAPTLLLIGSHDELVLPRFQRRYASDLAAHGTPTVALELPYANHAFDEVPYGRGLTFERAVLLRFLHAALRPAR